MHIALVLAFAAASRAAASPTKRSTTDPTQVAGKTFDFVIAGGGTAGLALAGRLAEWSNVTIAVIEAGSDGSNVQDQITIPGMSYLDGLTGTTYDWQYKTTPQTNASGGQLSWPRGKVLGGSSAINGGFWCRGSSAEYDAWKTLQNGSAGADMWGWDGMQAAINKAETFTPMSDDDAAKFSVTHDSSAHGSSGPIHASYSSYQFDHLTTWIPTMVAMGLDHTLDPANGTNIGVTFTPSIINPANGSRSDSNFGYITPYARPNLVILTGYQVTQVNWNDTTEGVAVASGVSFAANAGGTVYTVNATKEVIISGGTIGSPQILQLSGVGDKTMLAGLGITSVVDLPGVGANLQDHVSDSLYMQATDNNTWAALKYDQTLWADQLAIWKSNGTGMWTYWNEATAYPSMADLMGTDASTWASGIDVTAALTTATESSSFDSTVQAGIKAQYAIIAEWAASSTIGQVELIFNMFGSAASQIGIQFCIQHPFARGYVRITSASVFDYPDINPNYLSISYDLDVMRAALKYVRQIIATEPMKDMIVGETLPGTGTTTDDAIDTYVKNYASTEYHPCGTNSMLPKESGGVVDTTLTVYGTKNLRVVDVSVVPLHVSAHLMATAYGVAENAADIIKAAHFAVVNTTSSDPGSGSGSSGSTGSTGDANTTNASTLSTSTKIIIGAASGVAALVLLGVFVFFYRRRKYAKQDRAAAFGKNDDWHAEDDRSAYKPRAHFMGAGSGSGSDSRHSMSTAISMDSLQPEHQQQVRYDHDYAGQHYPHGYAAHDQGVGLYDPGYASAPPHLTPTYGALHSNLSTADVTALHAPSSPSSPSPPRLSDERYLDSPPPGAGYGRPLDH